MSASVSIPQRLWYVDVESEMLVACGLELAQLSDFAVTFWARTKE